MAVPPTMRRGNPEMETLQSVTSHQALNMVQALQNNRCIMKNLSMSVDRESGANIRPEKEGTEILPHPAVWQLLLPFSAFHYSHFLSLVLSFM